MKNNAFSLYDQYGPTRPQEFSSTQVIITYMYAQEYKIYYTPPLSFGGGGDEETVHFGRHSSNPNP